MNNLKTNFLKSSCLALLLSSAASSFAAPVPVDRIIALVNDDVVLESELVRSEREVRAQLESRKVKMPAQDVLRKQVLERLIMMKLQMKRADDAGIKPSDAEITEAAGRVAQQNGMSIGQFAESLRKEGTSYLDFREELKREMIMQGLRQREVEPRVQISEQDIDIALRNAQQQASADSEYLLTHILIEVPENASSADKVKLRERALEVQKRARNGEDFAALATAFSSGAQAATGGDLGWRKAAALPTLFADVAPKLNPNEVSDILTSPAGFHVLKLRERRDNKVSSKITETHARHILFRGTGVRSEKEAMAQCETAAQRLKNGEDFATLARDISEDKASAVEGGDLGWRSAGVYVKPFQEALDKAKTGELTAPFMTEYGCHIAQVLERRERDNSDEVRRAKIVEGLRERRLSEEYEAWLRQLRNDAYVDYKL